MRLLFGVLLMKSICSQILAQRLSTIDSVGLRRTLGSYPDEIDRDFEHASLGRENADAEDWRWA